MALPLASEAVTIARQTEQAIDTVQALVILAQAYGASGRGDEARTALAEAEEIARRRGWQPGLAQITALQADFAGATPG